MSIPQRQLLGKQSSSTSPLLNSVVISKTDVKVFLMGVDISAWFRSFSVTYADRDVGNCCLVLDSSNSAWFLTPDNLSGKWRSSADPNTDETAKQAIYNYKFSNQIKDVSTNTYRYNLSVWTAVIQRLDTVRIFVRLPWTKDSSRWTDKVWVPMFCGYVDSVDGQVSLTPSPITLNCVDLRGIMSTQRVIQNPYGFIKEESIAGTPVFDIGKFETQIPFRQVDLKTNLFADTRDKNSRIFSTIISNLDLVGLVELMFLGKRQRGKLLRPTETDPEIDGLGKIGRAFQTDTVDVFQPSDSDDLSQWYNKCLGLGDERQFPSKQEGSAFTLSEIEEIGKQSGFDGPWSPHGSNIRPRILYPKNDFGFRNIGDISQSQYETIDWGTRLDIIEGFLERLWYKFWISPLGDPIFEYPQWELLPSNYKEYSERTLNIENADAEEHYSYRESGDSVRTSVIVTGGMQQWQVDPLGNSAIDFTRVILFLPALVLRYGIRDETICFPWAYDCNILKFVGLLHLQRQLATVFTYEVSPLPFRLLLPNKPIFAATLDKLATVTNVTHSFDAESGTISTSFALEGIRERKPDGTFAHLLSVYDDSGNLVPFSYNRLFTPKTAEQFANRSQCSTPSNKYFNQYSNVLISPNGELPAPSSPMAINPLLAKNSYPSYTPQPKSNFSNTETAARLADTLATLPPGLERMQGADLTALSTALNAYTGGDPYWQNFDPITGEFLGTESGISGISDRELQELQETYSPIFDNLTIVTDTLDVVQRVIMDIQVKETYTPEIGIQLALASSTRALGLGDLRFDIDIGLQLGIAKLDLFLQSNDLELNSTDPLLQALILVSPEGPLLEVIDQYGSDPNGQSLSEWRIRFVAYLQGLLTNDLISYTVSAVASRF